MAYFKNRNQVTYLPRVWVASNGTRISWRSDTTLFSAFVSTVQAHARQNNLTEPTLEEIEARMCEQSARGDCTDDSQFHQPPTQRRAANGTGRSGGCKSCRGGR